METPSSGPLEAELRQATGMLKDALAEACGTQVERADTGQLARVEHVLMLAQDAARKAVSIRERKRRARRGSQLAPPAVAVADIPMRPGAHPDSGAHRAFIDAAGVAWDAFAVHPSADAAGKARLPEPYQRGWLSFDSGDERRRLSPIPDNWLTAPDYALRELCRQAEPAPRRAAPTRNTGPRPESDPA